MRERPSGKGESGEGHEGQAAGGANGDGAEEERDGGAGVVAAGEKEAHGGEREDEGYGDLRGTVGVEVEGLEFADQAKQFAVAEVVEDVEVKRGSVGVEERGEGGGEGGCPAEAR